MKFAPVLASAAAFVTIAGSQAVVHEAQPQVAAERKVRMASNSEMTKMFADDQAGRRNLQPSGWQALGEGDVRRRARTRELLRQGRLTTGEDFYHAAFIFQHGDRPDDYLLAHNIAIMAVSKGHPRAMWISAATLDRYHQEVKQPQIFGTQFSKVEGNGKWTSEPYNPAVVSDPLRKAFGVRTIAEQNARLIELNAGSQH